jgi:hypothetical protein
VAVVTMQTQEASGARGGFRYATYTLRCSGAGVRDDRRHLRRHWRRHGLLRVRLDRGMSTDRPALDPDARSRRLRAALGFLQLEPRAPELRLLHRWLDSWSGIGLVVAGMSHQGFQVSVGEHGAGQWIAVFYNGRGGHQPIAAAGDGAGRDAMAGGAAGGLGGA